MTEPVEKLGGKRSGAWLTEEPIVVPCKESWRVPSQRESNRWLVVLTLEDGSVYEIWENAFS